MLTIVEYHKARPIDPHAREEFLLVNYIQLVYMVFYITRKIFPSVICPVFQASYKFDPELFLNSESQLKFLERKNGEDSI